jgi:Cu/Ag efflux protein CusF
MTSQTRCLELISLDFDLNHLFNRNAAVRVTSACMGMTLLVLLALAQEPAAITRQVFEVSGKVDRVNRGARTITILSAGAASAPIYAGPDLAIFDGLNTGDFVVVRYYDSYIVELTPGKRMVPPEIVTGTELDELKTDDGRVLQQTRLVVTIDAIDVATGSVTYHGSDNRRVFRVVQDRKLLEGLKVGDVVTITFTRAQAVSIARAP